MGEQITVNVHGPIFDGHAEADVQEYLGDAVYHVGSQGLANWHQFLDQSIRHPTPYYETQAHLTRAATTVVVDDRGIVYGPWLEGVGSRNETTRFKGYFALRRAVQRLHGEIPQILADRLRVYLERMR
jgi:hypothetical protein